MKKVPEAAASGTFCTAAPGAAAGFGERSAIARLNYRAPSLIIKKSDSRVRSLRDGDPGDRAEPEPSFTKECIAP